MVQSADRLQRSVEENRPERRRQYYVLQLNKYHARRVEHAAAAVVKNFCSTDAGMHKLVHARCRLVMQARQI